ncbi:putative lipoprotein [Pseudomonas fluorescens]|uniref:Putative lipoprotein n=1 Tax=Pseudomonas fluorescens TaxID=294 RepID=A0A0P8ZUE3_PSEFL|nr:putative lipoprotein [Pseudomonas fluorescens]
MRKTLILLSALFLTACSNLSIDEMREQLPPKTYTSERAPDDFTECVVGVFNSNARGFEMIRFDGAKSFRQGNRTTITAETGFPMYILDVTTIGGGDGGSLIQERNLVRMPIGYLKRFQDLTKTCLL